MSSLLKVLKYRTSIVVLALAAVIGAVLLAAPPAIRSYAVDWLRGHGAPHAAIESIHFNPFSGTLDLDHLKTDKGLVIGKAGIDIDWWPLWHHEIYIRSINIDNTNLGLTTDKKGQWKISGLNFPSSDHASKPASNEKSESWLPVLHSARLKNIHIKLAGDGLTADIPIRSLKLDHVYMEQGKSQTLNAEIRLGRTMISSRGYHLANDSLRFQGQITIPDSGTQFSAQKITVEAKILSVKSKADHLALGIEHLLVSRASANGTTSLKAGDIEATSLKLNSNSETSPNSPAPLSLSEIRKISVRNIAVSNANQVSISRIDIQGTDLPSTEKHSLGNIGLITVTDGKITPGIIQLAQLEFHGLDLALEHQKGGIAVLRRLKEAFSPSLPSKPNPPAKSAPGTPMPASNPAHIDIGLITVDKGSKIDFRDSVVDPPFHTDLKVESFRISSLDTSGKKNGEVTGIMKLGNQGKLTLKGNINLQSAKSAAKFALDIKRLSMPTLTGYMENDFGHAIKTGQMDLNSRFSLRGNIINSKNRLAIRNLTLESSTQKGTAAQSLGMPLNMAVDMLRDDKGDIYLNVPIHGRINDPKVDIHDAIDKAILSAMKTAAMSYAALLLQPYGSILPAISLATKVIGQMNKPRLTPISFAPGSPALSTKAKAYIKKINELLKKKPFRLQVCGITSRIEMHPKSKTAPKSKVSDAENKQMLSLAKARSVAVIKAIVTGGISADRVFDCLPTIDNDPHAVGRVELLLN